VSEWKLKIKTKIKQKYKNIFTSIVVHSHYTVPEPVPLVAICTALRVRTAANCNVLMADRMSLPVAEHREDREDAAMGVVNKGRERKVGTGGKMRSINLEMGGSRQQSRENKMQFLCQLS
jgi:hypothetical protein